MHKLVQPPQISYRKCVLKLSTLRNPKNCDTLTNLLISPVSISHFVLGLQYCYCIMHGAGMGVVWQHTWHCELVSAPEGGGDSKHAVLATGKNKYYRSLFSCNDVRRELVISDSTPRNASLKQERVL